jgi:hypothetical protein
VKRGKAEELLDQIRQALVWHTDNGSRVIAITKELERAGLEPLKLCPGEAHKADHDIDHCMTCAPRWGVIGEREKIT